MKQETQSQDLASVETNCNDSIDDDDDMSVSIKLKWEGTSKIERMLFSKVCLHIIWM